MVCWILFWCDNNFKTLQVQALKTKQPNKDFKIKESFAKVVKTSVTLLLGLYIKLELDHFHIGSVLT